MSDHDSDEDDLLEQAYIFRTTGKYPEGCTMHEQEAFDKKEGWEIAFAQWRTVQTAKTEWTNSVSCIKWIGFIYYKDKAACWFSIDICKHDLCNFTLFVGCLTDNINTSVKQELGNKIMCCHCIKKKKFWLLCCLWVLKDCWSLPFGSYFRSSWCEKNDHQNQGFTVFMEGIE